MFYVFYLVHQMQILNHSSLILNVCLFVVDYVFVGRLFQSVNVNLPKKGVFCLIKKFQLVQDIIIRC